MELKMLAVSFALAFLVETITEYLAGTPLDKIEALKPYKWLLMYVAAGVGVGLCLYYQIDLIAIVSRFAAQLTGASTPLDNPTPVGQVLTGLVVGHGANYLSDFLAKYLKPPKV